jgi:uncharacterized Fe-S cluster-containing radical SAM superfamily enzyme
MQKYKLHPYLLPRCDNFTTNRGSYWCKTKCEFCQMYEEESSSAGILDYIIFTCTFNLRKEKLKKLKQ